MTVFGLLGLALVIMKLAGIGMAASWSWWLVTLPFWGGFAVVLSVWCGFGLMIGIATIFGRGR